MLALENLEDVIVFAFVCPADIAELRKKLKDTLQYVEAFAKNGYVGTVAGVNIYTKKDATPGAIYMATRDAVTLLIKGTEVEQDRDADKRENTIFSRKYYLAALTDETKVVKIMKGVASLTEDATVQEKTYYKKVGLGYVVAEPSTNPKQKASMKLLNRF